MSGQKTRTHIYLAISVYLSTLDSVVEYCVAAHASKLTSGKIHIVHAVSNEDLN
jgi:hypothetical protein